MGRESFLKNEAIRGTVLEVLAYCVTPLPGKERKPLFLLKKK